MAQGQNKVVAINFALSSLPSIIQAVENLFGPGNGADKNAVATTAAAGLATSVIEGAGALAAQNNPSLAPIAQVVVPGLASFFSTWISHFISARKAAGNPVTATPIADPAPAPAPAA